MKKDIEWLKKEIEEYLEYEGVRYARIALESVLGYIDQLDEPEKPVIPQFVADWIEKQMKFGYEDVFISVTRLRERAPEKVKFWVRNNADTYAHAWIDGYEVEKEKRRQRKQLNVAQERNNTVDRAVELIYQLDEPEKVVVPQFVADFIKVWKHTDAYSLQYIFCVAVEHSESDKFKKEYDWVRENDELFASAWLDGFTVEKEKLYRVRAGNRYVRFNLDGSIIGVKKDNSIVCLERLSKLPFDYKKAVESGIITLEEVTE